MRFSGAVGYATSEETAPGVYEQIITEKVYYGDVIRNDRRLVPPSQVPPVLNVGLSLENSFSIVGDADAYANYLNMRYVRWEGTVWQITNVEVRRPRLVLTVGGQWNGNTA
jgi:hypothetical protein